jgi:Sulfatase-modifying factor enzyme 1
MLNRECFTLVEGSQRTLPYDFYIATYPVIKSRKPILIDSQNAKKQKLYKPSWMDAIRYCNKLSLEHNLSPFYCEKTGAFLVDSNKSEFIQHEGFRLPTDKEWQTAAQAWTKSYSSCNEIQRKYYRIPFLDYPTTPEEKENYEYGYATVNQLIPNEIGIYGLLVYGKEWCSVTESYRNSQNQSVHWQEYITNYNNDIGYSITTTERTEKERHGFRVVLTKELAEWL